MACREIGEANADIAGIGIVSAFVFQALASWVLSAILEVVLADPLDHGSLHATRSVRRSLFSLASLRDEVGKIEQDLCHLTRLVEENALNFKQLSRILAILREEGQTYLQDLVGRHRSQNVPQTLVEENIDEKSPQQEARKVIAEILYFSSDVQTLAGIALALIGIIRKESLNLYQFHLIYDTINLTSISNCAALASATGVDTSDLLPRVLQMLVFGFIYLVFTVVFGVHLGKWDDKLPGRCYNSRGLALPDAHHPYVDKIYLGFTSFYMFLMLSLTLTIAISRSEVDPAWGKRRSALAGKLIAISKDFTQRFRMATQFVPFESWASQLGFTSIILYPFKIQATLARANPTLFIAMLQLPLHLYFVVRLRLTNEPLLSDGNDEIHWGFGQIYALIMSVGLVVECCKGYFRYWTAERHFKRTNQSTAKSHFKRENQSTANPDDPAPAIQYPDTAALEGMNEGFSDWTQM